METLKLNFKSHFLIIVICLRVGITFGVISKKKYQIYVHEIFSRYWWYVSDWNKPELFISTIKCNFCDQLKFDMTLRYFIFLNCVKIIECLQLSNVGSFLSLWYCLSACQKLHECYFFFEFDKRRAHSRTHVLMLEYAN